MPAVMFEALGQECVEGLAALTAEPGDEPLAAAIGGEHSGKELEGWFLLRLPPPLLQP